MTTPTALRLTKSEVPHVTNGAKASRVKPGAAELRFPALEVRQGPRRLLYSFAVDGKLLPQFTTISRLHREDDASLGGYQRPEVLSHITEIRDYIESDDPMIPNAVVIAFDRRVRFEPAAEAGAVGYSRLGTLVIPVDHGEAPEDRPGWIVDGQQRAAAIRDAAVERFPICVTAFITSDAHEQREQFILVNSTKPLPKGLIYELLPNTEARLPSALERRRFPSFLLDRLNHDEDSPLVGMIQTPTNPGGCIKDNSILRMLEHSLTDGALYAVRGGRDLSRDDAEPMLGLLKPFWSAVREVFPSAWGLPPRKSRLMHGAGVVAMGFLMDAIVDRYRRQGPPTAEQFAENLMPLRAACRWTSGEWLFATGSKRRWNEVQNTPKDIEVLVDHLLTLYKNQVWSRSRTLSAGTKR
jgi:DGQHR domain-containing protein